MKLAIIFNRYHTSMLCKRAPVHLIQSKQTSTSTSLQGNQISNTSIYTSMQGDQISNTSIYSEQIHISTNHNTFRQFIPTFNFVISSSDQKTFGSVLPSLLSSVDHNLYLNFSLNQRDNILLVTFLNQSSTH